VPFHLNKVIVAGTMTKDAEIKYTPQGTAIANVSLAINRVYYKGEGKNREKCEETTFVEVEAWGKMAETIKEHTGKGHTVFFEARLKLDQWEDKQTGQKRSKLRLSAEEFKFVSSPREKSDSDSGEGPPPSRPSQRPKPPTDPDLDQPEDDIPF
jgi:single-strand DNA-binding protein